MNLCLYDFSSDRDIDANSEHFKVFFVCSWKLMCGQNQLLLAGCAEEIMLEKEIEHPRKLSEMYRPISLTCKCI